MSDKTALQERILEDVLFALIKNDEIFDFEKLCKLFPMLERSYIQKRYEVAKSRTGLLDEILSKPPRVKKATVQEVQTVLSQEESISRRKSFTENSPKSTDKPIVTIHVSDDNREKVTDFSCGVDLLVQEMPYFDELIPRNEDELNELDISVQCDTDIFSILMQWVKRRELDKPFDITKPNIVSVLISANYLGMTSLIDIAAQKAAGFYNSINLNPLSKSREKGSKDLLKKVQLYVSAHEAQNLPDGSAKEDVFRRHVAKLIAETKFIKCKSCAKILPWKHRYALPCIPNKAQIDRNGDVRWNHMIEFGWDFVESELPSLQSKFETKQRLYWGIWGLANVFCCSVCNIQFQAADIQNCMYHPKEDIGGTYLCCKRKKQHFRSLMAHNGCTHRAHKIEDEKIQEYMEFIGVERNFKVGPIGPVWKEPEEAISLAKQQIKTVESRQYPRFRATNVQI
ncbi:Oidioi.mRNA.OKI2018_I69.PAR.g11250.t1.cds [Oikopleura dioica]|uniref:Oidioi.mRNA.OKI2018_I69.PAR.g11250.t1.cds n=1 Tax=Oikopleura dioica TaxID=34765 RepID=A0ABN7RZ36_OIKDI|nr:Oidioi.mRNA.OKI2018_I69.PAR.g11250.t1.cds [Oikopleura dioica]